MAHREIHIAEPPHRGKPTAEWGAAVVAALVEPAQKSSEVPVPFHAVANPVHVQWGRGINEDAEEELCLATVDLDPNMPALPAPLVDAEGDSGGSDNQRDHRDHRSIRRGGTGRSRRAGGAVPLGSGRTWRGIAALRQLR